MNKQTAVEWLFQELWDRPKDKMVWYSIFEKALQGEKEQITDAFLECWKANVPNGIECKLDAEQYYNENFKTQNQ